MDTNEKIKLDDILFDDVISGEGVTTEEVAPAQEEQKVEASQEEAEFEKEIEEKKEEKVEVEEKEVEPKAEEETQEETVEEEVEEEKVEDESETVVSQILGKLGYEGSGEYDDTTEGLVELTKDVASQMADDRLDEVLEAFPKVKEHIQYVLAGGNSDTFMRANDPSFDYGKLEIAEDDVHSQKAILSTYLQQKGHDDEFVKDFLGDLEDSGKLKSKAEIARKSLAKVQADERASLVSQQQRTMEQKAAKQQEFWTEINDTINKSDEFAGLSIPEKEKQKFFKYLSTPVDQNGYTQRDLDHTEANIEVKLAIDYLMYKGFDLKSIINTKARTTNATSLKDKINKNVERVKSAKKVSRRSKNIDLDELDLNF